MKDQAEEAEGELEREIYLSHRKSIDELRIGQLNTFDKSILTLSSTGLGFSVILLSAFATQGGLVAMKALAISWGLFVLTIAMNLVSYHTGAESARIDIDRLDQRMRDQKGFKELPNKWKTATHYLNKGVILSFTIGAGCLLYFASANAVAMDAQATAKKKDSILIQPPTGATVPERSDKPQEDANAPRNFPRWLPIDPHTLPLGATPSSPPIPRPGGTAAPLPPTLQLPLDKAQ